MNILNIGLIGVIRLDVDIICSVAQRIPVMFDPEQEDGRRFRQIAQNLVTNEQEMLLSEAAKVAQASLFLFQRNSV